MIEDQNLTFNLKKKKIKGLLPLEDPDFKLRLKMMKEKSQLLKGELD